MVLDEILTYGKKVVLDELVFYSQQQRESPQSALHSFSWLARPILRRPVNRA